MVKIPPGNEITHTHVRCFYEEGRVKKGIFTAYSWMLSLPDSDYLLGALICTFYILHARGG